MLACVNSKRYLLLRLQNLRFTKVLSTRALLPNTSGHYVQ